MTVKISILYDNRCDNCQLQECWGFSALVEYDGNKLLFDTGGNLATFSSNAEKMNLPYKEITQLVLSHWHWDHIAGFQEIAARLSNNAVLYVPKMFPWFLLRKGATYFKKKKVVRSFEAIAPNIYSLVLRGGFCLYEQALVLETPKGLGIITGCGHLLELYRF